MPSSGTISFHENPNGIYGSGEVLSGKVNLETDKIKAIKGIVITICGYADVEWSEEESTTGAEGQNETETVLFKAREEYFCSKADALESPDGNRFDLMPGKYEFNFQTQLPTSLPTSFRGKYGEVHYEVVCEIHRPWRFNDVIKQPFNIISKVDLNTNPIYRLPSNRSTVKYFSRLCCCGHSGHIIVNCCIPYSGFAPGQSVPIKVNIKNLSDVECHESNIKLVKMVEYLSQKPRPKSKYDTEELATQKFGTLSKSQCKELHCKLKIPPTPPSSLSSCKIIEISYFVEVQLKTKGFYTNMYARLPITIGTVPMFYGGDFSPCVITAQPLSLQGGIRENTIAGLVRALPPSYEEAMQSTPAYKRSDDEHKFIEKVEFVPKYPVYHYSPETITASSNLVEGNNSSVKTEFTPTKINDKYVQTPIDVI